jgi:hypothetical protein
MTTSRYLTAALAAAATSGVARAQITPVSPFTGPFTESFETVTANFEECVNGQVFAGQARVCTPGWSGCLVTQFWSSFCVASARTGANLFGSNSGVPEFVFGAPIRRFGGYFCTISGSPNGTARFYDDTGGLVGSATLFTNACTWTWNGWESATPFVRVTITGNNPIFNGGFVQMDDLEYQGVSQPCYANCDGSTTAPILNISDFVCFQALFAAGDSRANCDGSTTPPTLNVNDFVCFQTAFAAGCP